MANITILEQDLTVSNSVISDTDVVYIPGFVSADASGADIVGQYIPTKCTTLSEFHAKFGNAPATFASAQTYPTNFAADAIPTGVNMFASGASDPSFIMAEELLALGIPVIYERVNEDDTDITVAAMYTALSTVIYKLDNTDNRDLSDKGEYSFKYLTSGGYPTFEYRASSETGTTGNAIVVQMMALAANRGDCVALIDHTNNADRTLYATSNGSVFYSATNTSSGYRISADGGYGAMFTPWWSYTAAVSAVSMVMPASFAYLLSLAKSLQTNANWLSIAGVARGIVPNFGAPNTTTPLTNRIADSYQNDNAISINAIARIGNYGYCVWGNRTLLNNATDGLKATSFLNIRNLVSDVKKLAFETARRFMFEQNSEILKINFKAAIEPTLDKMKTGNGLSSYKIVFTNTNEKGKLNANIILTPIYAVEDITINVSMIDDEVNVQ